MTILIIFAFLAGLVTVLSPCILPILPIVLSGALSGGKWRPLGVITGFILSFTFFATFSFTIARVLGITTEALRYISVVLLIIFGVSVFIPKVQFLLENIASRFTSVGQKKREGFSGGVILGISLGFVWTPCVGPILGSVLTLAATSQLTIELILITLAFSIGTALPMLAIAYGGQHVIQTLPILRRRSLLIQKIFGVLILATALMILFNFDRTFQVFILEKFPQYGEGLTSFEKNNIIKQELDQLREKNGQIKALGIDGEVEKNFSQPAPNLDFEGGGTWLNSKPLSLKTSLAGKVVLVDFWTYTCINCIRTFPHLKAWYQNYKEDGFVIVGVHTPEFEFEKRTKNIQMALKKYGLTYPVVQDNDFKIWNSYSNQYWPAHYLIDRTGKIRYIHFGEGEYDTTESMIRKLLTEGGTVTRKATEMDDMTPTYRITPESYLGYGRIERFGSQEKIAFDKPFKYSFLTGLPDDYFAYDGLWTVGEERALSSKNARLYLNFKAKSVFLVMRATDKPGKVKVYIDDKLVTVGGDGSDMNDGIITVTEDRLYTIIELKAVESHILKLEFIDNPIEVYAFTFG